ANGCRDTAADATNAGPTLFRSQADERLEPLTAAKLDEQRQECDEDRRAPRLDGGADQVQRRPRRSSELSRVHRSSRPLDDLETILEKTEPSIPARQVLKQLRNIGDESTGLVYERCEEQVRESEEREHEECESDADGAAAAQTAALERLDERLGRHCEHHRYRQLSQDDSRRIHQRKEQERADRDDYEEDDRSRSDSDERRSLAYTSGTRSAFRSDMRIRCGHHAYAPIIALSEVTVAVAGGVPGNRGSPFVVATEPSCWTGKGGRVAEDRRPQSRIRSPDTEGRDDWRASIACLRPRCLCCVGGLRDDMRSVRRFNDTLYEVEVMTDENRPIVRVEGVSKTFGEVLALDSVSLEFERGIIYGLLGPNGAGKTTLIRVLTTLLRPDSGRVEVAGVDVVADPTTARTRIGLAGQFAAVDDYLTGRENIEMVGRLYNLSKTEARSRATDLLERINLSDAADRTVRTYSGGMRRRLDLAASLIGRPEVLFLDEPTTGVDPRSRIDLWELIEDLVRAGTTVLLTTQYLDEADTLAERLAVIDRGRLISEGTPDELKDRLGGSVIRLSVPKDQWTATMEALRATDGGDPQLDELQGRITIPAPLGVRSLQEAVRRLDAASIVPDDIALLKPTLDDVFLALTGRAPAADETAAAPAARRRLRIRR
ncbi:MAG: type transport system ATP-binding protein, partial [Gaiellaceae bacterium]|nr:type transport system ATP-binding protein [Gaiellaceae bacterium]